ncbi:hypothetical protein B0T13DRAFT_475481 [Neurospora crassa]|nr:hypothetical protein B0T13DRAFT_475481 [Neurospora crassa]
MLVMSIAAFARRITHHLRYLTPTLALAVCHVDPALLPPHISGLADKIGGMFWFARPAKVTRMEARQKAGSQEKAWIIMPGMQLKETSRMDLRRFGEVKDILIGAMQY